MMLTYNNLLQEESKELILYIFKVNLEDYLNSKINGIIFQSETNATWQRQREQTL